MQLSTGFTDESKVFKGSTEKLIGPEEDEAFDMTASVISTKPNIAYNAHVSPISADGTTDLNAVSLSEKDQLEQPISERLGELYDDQYDYVINRL